MKLPKLPALGLPGACLASALALSLMLAVPPAHAADDPVVAKVNGTEIHQSDLAMAEEDLGGNTPQMTPRGQARLSHHLRDRHDARRQGGRGQEGRRQRRVQAPLAYARTKLLMETCLQAEAQGRGNRRRMHKVYDEAIGQMKAEPEVRARHILVETEDEAKAVLAELKKGADFAELAKAKSKDPGSADGGDLGYFTKDQMVPEFAEVAFKLDKGAALRAGEVAVRLACHQGRGQAREARRRNSTR